MNEEPLHEPLPHFLLFWILSAMALAAALPCLLVPPIEALQRLAGAEARLHQRLTLLEQAAQRCRDMKEALRNDPLINSRLAQRDLRYRPAGRVEFVSAAGVQTGLRPRPPRIEPNIPAWIRGLYPAHWAVVYRLPLSRHFILLLSVGVLTFAVCAFGTPAGNAGRVTRRAR